jgi:(2Fe-2S) ferredoxin
MEMNKPKRHVFLCKSYRANGEGQGACAKKGAGALIPYLESEIADRGMSDVMVSSCGCLKACDHGPVMVVYPEGLWIGGVDSEEKVDEVLDALEAGNVPKGSF